MNPQAETAISETATPAKSKSKLVKPKSGIRKKKSLKGASGSARGTKRGAKRPKGRRQKRKRWKIMQSDRWHNSRELEPSDGVGSYDRGFQEGFINGQELLLAEHIPYDVIIPDLTVREAVAAGIQVLRGRGVRSWMRSRCFGKWNLR